MPITFTDEFNYDELGMGNKLNINNIAQSLKTDKTQINVINTTNGQKIECDLDVTRRQREILLVGGLLNHVGV